MILFYDPFYCFRPEPLLLLPPQSNKRGVNFVTDHSANFPLSCFGIIGVYIGAKLRFIGVQWAVGTKLAALISNQSLHAIPPPIYNFFGERRFKLLNVFFRLAPR